MTDIEFILFLCNQINNICGDGDEPDMGTIEKELDRRNIEIEDVFIY